MMDAPTIIAAAAVLGLLLNVGLSVWGGGWNLSAKLADMEKRLSQSIADAKTEVESRQESATKNYGEGLAALRAHVHEMEKWVRDTFVRRDSFLQVTSEVKGGIKELGDRLERRLDKMEEKISDHSN